MDMYEMGITAVVLPEFDRMIETPQNTPYHRFDVGRHSVEVLKNVPATKVMRYAALLHDAGKVETRTTDENGRDHFKGHSFVSEKIAEKILKRLRMDNDTIKDVKTIVLWHDYGIKGDISKKSVRKMLSQMGEEYFDRYVEIKRADIKGQSDYKADVSVATLEQIIRYHDEIMDEGNALSIKDLAISGKDLIDMGIKPGPEMGQILRELLEKVLEEPELNTREALEKLVENKAK
jgi:tRNA nucleotidyltransferase (CCA-adding enzyme)